MLEACQIHTLKHTRRGTSAGLCSMQLVGLPVSSSRLAILSTPTASVHVDWHGQHTSACVGLWAIHLSGLPAAAGLSSRSIPLPYQSLPVMFTSSAPQSHQPGWGCEHTSCRACLQRQACPHIPFHCHINPCW